MPARSSIRNSGICLTRRAGCGTLDSDESTHTYFSFPYCIIADPKTPATKADIDGVNQRLDVLTQVLSSMRSEMLSWKDDVVAHFDDSLRSLESKLLDFHELERTAVLHERRITRLEQTMAA